MFRVAVAIALFTFTLGACGEKDNSANELIGESSNSKPTVYFLQGDVDALIKGSTPDGVSFFSINDRDKFSDYHLSNFHIFTSQTKLNLSTAVDGKVKAEPELPIINELDSDEPVKLDRFEFRSEDSRYFYEAKNIANYPKFIFENTADDTLELVALKPVGAELISVQSIHYSKKKDLSLFSILFSFEFDGATHLGSIAFTKNQSPSLEPVITDKPYPYLAGRGIGAKWRDNVEFSICGSKALAQKDTIIAAIKAWDQEGNGKIGNLSYSIVELANPKPFSDVNQNCIFAIEGYRQESKPEDAVLGLALLAVNPTLASIEAASSLIFTDAHARSEVTITPETTVTHETGHMLGLGHEFAVDQQGKQKYLSIMSYNGETEVSNWDFEAIDGLYNTNPSQIRKDQDSDTMAQMKNAAADNAKKDSNAANRPQNIERTSFIGF